MICHTTVIFGYSQICDLLLKFVPMCELYKFIFHHNEIDIVQVSYQLHNYICMLYWYYLNKMKLLLWDSEKNFFFFQRSSKLLRRQISYVLNAYKQWIHLVAVSDTVLHRDSNLNLDAILNCESCVQSSVTNCLNRSFYKKL